MSVTKGAIEEAAERYMPDFMRPFWRRIIGSDIGYRLAHGAFWSTIGAGLSQSLMLLTSIIAARILGREQFGQYGIVISTVGMFSVFAGFGLGTTATKFVAEYKHSNQERASRIIAISSLVALGTGVVASLILLVIAPLVAKNILAAPQLSGLLRIAAGIVFFGAVNSAQIGVLAGFEAFRAIARINIISGVLSFILVAGGIFFMGIPGALMGQVAAAGISCFITTYAVRKAANSYGVLLSYKGCSKEKSVLISFSLPAVMSGIMVSPVNWACSALLVNQVHGYAEMGLFNAANSWQKAILFIPGCLGAIALPMLSNLHGSDRKQEYRKALRYNLGLNGICAFLVFLIVSMLSKFIMRSYGASFEIGYIVLILLCFSSVLVAIGSVIGNAIASVGKMWYGFVFNGLWGLTYIGASFLLVPRFGATGLALSYVIAYILHTFWQFFYLKKILE